MIQWKSHMAGFTGAHQYAHQSFMTVQKVARRIVTAVVPIELEARQLDLRLDALSRGA